MSLTYCNQLKRLNLQGFLLANALLLSTPAIASNATDSTPDPSDGPLQNDSTTPFFQSRFVENNRDIADYSILDGCPVSPADITNEAKSSVLSGDVNRFLLRNNLNDNANVVDETSIKMWADAIPVNDEEQVRLEGNVVMSTQSSLLKADVIESDKNKESISATGNVSVETELSLLRAKRFQGDQNTLQSQLEAVQFHFFESNINGQADNIQVSKNNQQVLLNDLDFSTCPSGEKAWSFSASELDLNRESGRGEAWNMWLKIKGIPVFYLPYLNFPVDDKRKSGLLFPERGSGGRNGLDWVLPIYWNIAPDRDATFRPRYIENRGLHISTEYRHMTKTANNEIRLEWLEGDKLSRGLLSVNPSLGTGRYSLSDDRWGIVFNNQTRWNDNWTAGLNIQKVSDRDYLRDLGSTSFQVNDLKGNSQLLSSGHVTYEDDIWEVLLRAESTQTLNGEEPYRILPSLQANATYFEENYGVLWELQSEITQFRHTNLALVEGARAIVKPSVSLPLQSSYAWLTPKLTYHSALYEQRQTSAQGIETDFSESLNLPVFSLDSGIYFDREMAFEDKALVHSLEPRVFFAYIPQRDQNAINNFDTRLPDSNYAQLWQANRFTGNDRLGDTNHISVALTNRFTSEKTGKEYLSISFGRKRYFEDRQVTLNTVIDSAGLANSLFDTPENQNKINYSPWLFDLSFNPNDALELTSRIEWSDGLRSGDAHKNTNLARTRIKYEPIADHIVNISHRVRDIQGRQNEEVDISFAWPIDEEWRVVGRWYGDLRQDRTAESLFGVEYESCCWAVSVVARRYLDVLLDSQGLPVVNNLAGTGFDEFNSGIQIRFDLKGISSAASSGNAKLLAKSIRGYQSRF